MLVEFAAAAIDNGMENIIIYTLTQREDVCIALIKLITCRRWGGYGMEGINLKGKIIWKKKRGAPLPQSQGFFFPLSPFSYFFAFALILWTLKFDSHQ